MVEGRMARAVRSQDGGLGTNLEDTLSDIAEDVAHAWQEALPEG
jgi:hypothetical protein